MLLNSPKTTATTTFESFEANEPTNYFGQSVKQLKQVWQTRHGRPLAERAIQTRAMGKNDMRKFANQSKASVA